MAAHTILLTYEAPLLDFAKKDDREIVIKAVSSHLTHHGFRITHSYQGEDLSSDKNQMLICFISINGSDAVLRGHKGGLITLDLHEYVDKGSTPKFTEQIVSQLEFNIKAVLCGSGKTPGCTKSKSFPAIRRGEEVDVYYPTVDRRLAEYDFRNVVFQSQSQYQDILIVHSETLGNVLILDGDINMGESDVIYSHTLMQRGSLDYAGKTCLVLGGGDGGLLNELLKEKPKMVTMVDIDEAVLTAVKTHLHGVCGNSLDSLEGPNYQVIIGDALELLQTYVEEGRQFDYVLYDLTSIPITPEEEGDDWEFCVKTHNLAIKVLAPGGKYLAQVHAVLARRSTELFESLLRDFETPVAWSRHEAFIPSFSEVWAFYQIWKRSTADDSEEHRIVDSKGIQPGSVAI